MSNGADYENVLRRLDGVECRISNLESLVQEQAIVDAKISTHIEMMRKEFESLRSDVLITIKEHTDKTWGLIHKELYIIGVLIVIIVTMVGVKIAPELLKTLI